MLVHVRESQSSGICRITHFDRDEVVMLVSAGHCLVNLHSFPDGLFMGEEVPDLRKQQKLSLYMAKSKLKKKLKTCEANLFLLEVPTLTIQLIPNNLSQVKWTIFIFTLPSFQNLFQQYLSIAKDLQRLQNIIMYS